MFGRAKGGYVMNGAAGEIGRLGSRGGGGSGVRAGISVRAVLGGNYIIADEWEGLIRARFL